MSSSRENGSKFWLKDNKTSLRDSLSKITSFKLPKQSPVKAPVERTKMGPTNSYIRMEQLDQAYKQYTYSEFIAQLNKHAPAGTEANIDALDLFIRSLRPDVKVTCTFNHLLRSGSIELISSEESIKMIDSFCQEMDAIQGKSIVLGTRIVLDISFLKNCLVLSNVQGLKVGMDILQNFIQAPINKITFRVFDSGECLQVFYSDNPLAKVRPELGDQITFLRAAFL